MVAVSTPPTPTHLTSLLASLSLFFKARFEREAFDDVAGVQGELLATLDSIWVEDFRQCFQQREQPWDCCIQSEWEHFEGGKNLKIV